MTVQPTRDQLRALANAATPGPWEVHGSLIGIGRAKPDFGQTWGLRWRQDIEFICAARTAVPALLDLLAAAEHRADEAEGVHRDLTSSLGFGDGITEPMADNKTIIKHVGEAVTDAQELWELTQAACVEAGCDPEEDCYDHHPVRRAERAEHRATRAEAQSAIRGRAVVMYRNRAREAEERIKAVRDVHTGTVWPGVADKPICDACDQPWPCDTIRALD